jgi:hypothetical protein
MEKFNFDAETVGKFHDYAWLVFTDIKPASSFNVDSKEEYDKALEYVHFVFPNLKTYRRDIDEDLIEIHVYKYDHIRLVLDELFNDGLSNNMYHVLNGYIYGIPANMIEEFIGG